MDIAAVIIAGLVAFGLTCFIGAMLLDRRGGTNG